MKTSALALGLCLCAYPAQAASNNLDLLWAYDNPRLERAHYSSKPKSVAHKPKPKPKKHKPREGYSYRPPPPPPVPPDSVTRCVPPVRVVGSQWPTDGGAEESAQKAWAEAVRHNFGEAWMDLQFSEEYRKRCTRSSIGEIAGQTMHRCEIEARPCRPGFTEGNKP